MATLVVPPLEAKPWPTLGQQVAEWIEEFGCYGPGDLAGKRYVVEDDFRAQIFRAYEVYPHGHRLAGRRRFKHVGIEERKGLAKSERGALLAFAESHPDAPVRCDGFRRVGSRWDPVGRGVNSPYVPMVAYTVEQLEDLAYNVLRFIIENSDLAGDYDVGLERALLLDGHGREAGRIVPLASSPNARDGARTTFQYFDEPHRMDAPRLKHAFTTMQQNVFKRPLADAWTLTTSTAGEPGKGSVEEDVYEHALAVADGKATDDQLFFFRRFCPNDWPMQTRPQVRKALVEASGPNKQWSADLDALVAHWFQPKTDRAYYRRVWLNQWFQGGDQAFDMVRWAELKTADPVPDGALVTAGFDGSSKRDSTALVITDVLTGRQDLIGVWERPSLADDDWEIPRDEVTATVLSIAERWDLWRLYADPYRWGPWIDDWAAELGAERIVKWDTTRLKQMGYAVRNYAEAQRTGAITHVDNETYDRHLANAYKKPINIWDEEGIQLWVLTKERPGSPRKIDAAIAGTLSWEARGDALSAGATKTKKRSKVMRTS